VPLIRTPAPACQVKVKTHQAIAVKDGVEIPGDNANLIEKQKELIRVWSSTAADLYQKLSRNSKVELAIPTPRETPVGEQSNKRKNRK
jgi:hypothetical protein